MVNPPEVSSEKISPKVNVRVNLLLAFNGALSVDFGISVFKLDDQLEHWFGG